MNVRGEKAFLVFGGGNDRAVIGFLRVLRRCKQRAYVVARTAKDRILQTRYKRDVRWIRPDHTLSMDVFSECIKQVRKNSGARSLVVLPSTEYFNTFLLKHRHEIEQMGCEVPLVDARLYARLTDKRTATNFFTAAGIQAPAEISASAATTPPLVAKPLSNISTQGESLYPKLLTTIHELEDFRREHDPSGYFFQEYVNGASVYLMFYLSRADDQAFVWSQRNLMQQPEGKSMLLAEPSDFHTSQTAERILQALRKGGFRGLGMVEIIRTGDRDVFIEMNPRIWGPVQFCVDQGQPLLQAFIGDCLHNDPRRYIQRQPSRRRRHYFWLGGLADTLCKGGQPTWHSTRRFMPFVIFRNIACDVYLRGDSWICFFRDLKDAIRTRWKRERPQG